MDVHVALDALLAFIVLLFVPLGLWRGAAREAMVAAAILLGAALAGAWARPWGDDLAARTAFEPPTARFAVAIAALALCTLCLGYGGGAVWRGAPPGTFGRLVGGLLAALNGILLLGFSLNFVDRYLLEGDTPGTLADGRVARVLLTQFGWLLLAGAIALFLVVAVGLIVSPLRGTSRQTPPFPAMEPLASSGGTPRRRPPRVPTGTDTGKAEPIWREYEAEEVRDSRRTPQWAPIAPRSSDDRDTHRPHYADDPRNVSPYGPARQPLDEPAGGTLPDGSGATVANEWLRRTAAMSRPAESNADASVPYGAGSGAAHERRSGADDRGSAAASSFSIVDLGQVRRSHRGQWGQDEAFAAGSQGSADPNQQRGRFAPSSFERTDSNPRGNRDTATRADRRCATCSEPLAAHATFCTNCGAQAERERTR